MAALGKTEHAGSLEFSCLLDRLGRQGLHLVASSVHQQCSNPPIVRWDQTLHNRLLRRSRAGCIRLWCQVKTCAWKFKLLIALSTCVPLLPER